MNVCFRIRNFSGPDGRARQNTSAYAGVHDNPFFMKPDIPRCVKIRARPHQINNTFLFEFYYREDTHGCLAEINLHNRF